MHFLCIGMGAVGGYIGGSLVHAGLKVTFLLRSYPDCPPDGFKLEIRHGARGFAIQPELLVGSLVEAISLENYDAILLAVKTYDLDQVMSKISQFDRRLPPVICFQNGVETEEKLAKIIGCENVIPATLTSAISRGNHGRITIEKLRGIGIADGHELTSSLLTIFNRAGLNARIYADAKRMKWSKMLTNLLCNASSAILSMSPAEIMANPDLYQLEALQIREALNVMRALDLKVTNLPGTPVKPFSILFRYLPWQIGRLIARRAIGSGRGEKMPSLYLDLHLKKKKSEVLALNGAVSRYGAYLGIETPVCTLLTKTLLSLVKDPAQIVRYDHHPQELLKQLAL
jgi:2-dehydropantoate 2-reductase